MKQKVSDYIADYIANWGIRDVFTVTGGGAMHMNDAFGHHPKLHCTYQHHEQACAMAAEAYARMDNRMAAVCVTTGPGATNAITGVLGCWMDSIPMIVFSGQARYATTVAASGLKLRSMGVQECNIVPVVTSLTKYAQMVIDPKEIRYHLEKALYMAVNGRPGPVWLDIPLDVQGATIATENLRGYDPKENPEETPAAISQDVVKAIVDRIAQSRRPVLFPGNGVRLPPCMPFPRALTGFPVSSTAKVMYCRMLDAMLSKGQEDENGILFVCFPVLPSTEHTSPLIRPTDWSLPPLPAPPPIR